ncbi:MAG: phytanoyl-CoA dioxygenase family protein [Sphingobacteriales bacterium]|nr:phytanoyl-CoA dioxygenase family protein [Sphingobacteriales bacterium]
MKNFIQHYTGFIRNIRFFHYLYNWLHRKGLKHNEHLYPYYGIKKSLYASISHNDFNGMRAKTPWLDGIISKKDIENHPLFPFFPEEISGQVLNWQENGYIIWNNFLSSETADDINDDIDELLNKKAVDFNYTGRKIFNAYRQSYTLRKVIKDKRLLELLSFLLGKKVLPFQTINFLKGSEQEPHSDYIHMSTFPQGYLIAVWLALEDISFEQGPLSYYEQSHQLPYLTNDDYDNSSSRFLLDGNANKKYEAKVQQLIDTNLLQKKIFTAKKGDVFIWHGNLIHAGEPMLNPALTRKSVVAHYFAEGVICYHEISERPAIFDTELVGEVKEDFYKGQTHFFDV